MVEVLDVRSTSPAEVFRKIRDVPYRYFPYLREEERLMKVARGEGGTCTAKNHLLGEILRNIYGMEIKYVNIRFSWQDLNVEYPRELKELLKKAPEMSHLALLVNNIPVDATWDYVLIHLGFPYLTWDGGNKSSGFAVPPREMKTFNTFEERQKYARKIRKEMSERDFSYGRKFLIELSRWLDSFRTRYYSMAESKNYRGKDWNTSVRMIMEELRKVPYEEIEKRNVKKRLQAFEKMEVSNLTNDEDVVYRAYRILMRLLNLKEDEVEIVYRSPTKIVWHSKNPCPVLEACAKLGLDTRKVCLLTREKPYDEVIKRVHPKLKFGRNYKKIRPYARFCEEYIELT